MAHSLTLPTIGILALAGAGIGVYLGNDSISQINPIYFQEPPTRFHADLAANRSSSVSWQELRMDAAAPIELGADCVGCRTYPEEYRPTYDPAIDAALSYSPASRPPVHLAAAAAVEGDVAAREADLQRLQRYAAFAVSAEAETAEASTETEAAEAESAELAAMD